MSTDPDRIRILCVDDHPVVREGIAGLVTVQPDMVLVAEAANGREAISQRVGVRADLRAHPLPVGREGVHPLPRARSPALG